MLRPSSLKIQYQDYTILGIAPLLLQLSNYCMHPIYMMDLHRDFGPLQSHLTRTLK